MGTSPSMPGRRVSATFLLLAIGLVLLLAPGRASAHAFLDHSTPAANDVISTPSAEAQLWFTEPVEPTESDAELFDATGKQITTQPSHMGNDPKEIILTLPTNLPKGTYTI